MLQRYQTKGKKYCIDLILLHERYHEVYSILTNHIIKDYLIKNQHQILPNFFNMFIYIENKSFVSILFGEEQINCV